MRMWLAQTVASGMVPWFHWLGGSPEDKRWRGTGQQFYEWLAANEAHFRNHQSMTDLAVLYPQSTIAFGRRRDRSENSTDYLQGLYYALLDGRFLFDFVHQENLSASTLSRYRLLLVPNAAYLRDGECEAIREYVRSGGSVLATFETSRYNEWGEKRQELGLADVFGVSMAVMLRDRAPTATCALSNATRSQPTSKALTSFRDRSIDCQSGNPSNRRLS